MNSITQYQYFSAAVSSQILLFLVSHVNWEDVIILIVAQIALYTATSMSEPWVWVSWVSCITHHYIMKMEIIQLKTVIEAGTFFTRDRRAREHPFLYGDLW